MKNFSYHILAPLGLMALLCTPLHAQDDDSLNEGMALLGDGMSLILDGLMEEMGPALEQAQPILENEVLPMLSRMGELIDDISLYELPERLPNGDIIIRRSPDAPVLEAESEEAEGIDL